MLGHLTKQEELVVKNIANRIRQLLKDQLIILEIFGSKIRGDFTPDSDIDILIVVKDKNVKLKDKLYDILFEIDPYYEYKISLIIYSEFEFEQNIKLESPFIEYIQKEGIRL